MISYSVLPRKRFFHMINTNSWWDSVSELSLLFLLFLLFLRHTTQPFSTLCNLYPWRSQHHQHHYSMLFKCGGKPYTLVPEYSVVLGGFGWGEGVSVYRCCSLILASRSSKSGGESRKPIQLINEWMNECFWKRQIESRLTAIYHFLVWELQFPESSDGILSNNNLQDSEHR